VSGWAAGPARPDTFTTIHHLNRHRRTTVPPNGPAPP